MFDGLRLAIGGQDRGAPAAPERQRGIFADFKPLATAADPARAAQTDREHVRRLAVERPARAILDIRKMKDKDLPILPNHRPEHDKESEMAQLRTPTTHDTLIFPHLTKKHNKQKGIYKF